MEELMLVVAALVVAAFRSHLRVAISYPTISLTSDATIMLWTLVLAWVTAFHQPNRWSPETALSQVGINVPQYLPLYFAFISSLSVTRLPFSWPDILLAL